MTFRNDKRDYLTHSQETWTKISLKFYGSPNFVDVLLSGNNHLSFAQKKGIFAPANVWINIPEIKDIDRLQLDEEPQEINPWYEV